MAEVERRTVTSEAEWLAWRLKNLNASEIAACFGLHPYTTLAKLVAQKRGVEGLGPDPEAKLLRRGKKLEDDAADEIREMQPTWIIEKATDYYIDTEHRIACTPDFFCSDPDRPGVGVLQTKVVSRPIFRRDWDVESGTPPTYSLLQCATEMMLTDAAWGAVGALVIGDFSYDGFLFPVERHRGAEKRLIDAATEFWRVFDAGETPTLDYERDQKLIALLYPQEIKGKIVDLTRDNRAKILLEDRERYKASITELETALAKTEGEFKAKMRDAEAALVDGWKVTFKAQDRKEHKVRASHFRVLRAKRILEEKKEEQGNERPET